MIGIKRTSSIVRVAVAAPLIVLGLAACGGGSAGTTASTATPTATPTGQGGGSGGNFQEIQSCLTAAGISIPTPSGGMPTGGPGGGGTPPSGAPSGTPPSGAPGGGNGDGSGDGNGGGRGGGMQELFTDSTVQAALKACGITVPTGGARPSGTATAG